MKQFHKIPLTTCEIIRVEFIRIMREMSYKIIS